MATLSNDVIASAVAFPWCQTQQSLSPEPQWICAWIRERRKVSLDATLITKTHAKLWSCTAVWSQLVWRYSTDVTWSDMMTYIFNSAIILNIIKFIGTNIDNRDSSTRNANTEKANLSRSSFVRSVSWKVLHLTVITVQLRHYHNKSQF